MVKRRVGCTLQTSPEKKKRTGKKGSGNHIREIQLLGVSGRRVIGQSQIIKNDSEGTV